MVNFEDISMTLKEQSAEKVLGCVGEFTCTKSIFWKDENGVYLRLKLHVQVVVDYADTQFLNFVSFQNLLAWSAGAQEESFGQKKEAENLVTSAL